MFCKTTFFHYENSDQLQLTEKSVNAAERQEDEAVVKVTEKSMWFWIQFLALM